MKPIRLLVALAMLLGSTLQAQVEFNILSDGTIGLRGGTWNGTVSQTDTLASVGNQGGTPIGNLTADFSTEKTFKISFFAPTGTQFVVDPTAWLAGSVTFKMELRTGSQISPFYSGYGVFQWIGATGTAPTVTPVVYGSDESFSVGTNQYVTSQSITAQAQSVPITEAFTFKGFTYTLTAPQSFTQVFADKAWMIGSVEFRASAPEGSVSSDPAPIVSLQSIPEPNSFVILGISGMALASLRRKRQY